MNDICDEECDKIQNDIKDLLSPMILILIKKANRQLKKEGNHFILIVSGGEAIYRFFPKDKKLRSHDFDLKLAPVIKSGASGKPNSENQHRAAVKLSIMFEKELNKYIKSIIDDIPRELRDVMVFDERNNFFKAVKHIRKPFTGELVQLHPRHKTPLSKTMDLYALVYSIKLYKHGIALEDGMVDIFTAKPKNAKDKASGRVHYYDHITAANKSMPRAYIPYVLIEGVPYASLGYLIWDTLRMIKDSELTDNPKVDRYRMKLTQMIEGLYHPVGSLSCVAMEGFVQECSKRLDECKDNAGNKYTKPELLDYAVKNGFIPYSLRKTFNKELSKKYLCDYILHER